MYKSITRLRSLCRLKQGKAIWQLYIYIKKNNKIYIKPSISKLIGVLFSPPNLSLHRNVLDSLVRGLTTTVPRGVPFDLQHT